MQCILYFFSPDNEIKGNIHIGQHIVKSLLKCVTNSLILYGLKNVLTHTLTLNQFSNLLLNLYFYVIMSRTFTRR